MKQRIEQLLELSVNAPSGDNCQPWKFIIEDNRVHILNLPQKDNSLYNYKQRASFMAHGALLENLAISAPALGISADILEFPDPTADPDLVATVIFSEGEKFEDPLHLWIERRCTNRKKYNDTPLTKSQKNSLLQLVEEIPGFELHLVDDPARIQILASLLANNDRLVIENRHLHRFLFDHIRWNSEQAKRTLDGMDIKTFELSFGDKLAFRIIKYWPVVRILNKIGLSSIVAQNGRRLARSSAGIAALTIEGVTSNSFLRNGRIMQRFWLQATALGLSVQPFIGLPLLIQRVRSGEKEKLSDRQRQVIMTVDEQLGEAFDWGRRSVVMMFRIGTCAPPSTRSLRLPIK